MRLDQYLTKNFDIQSRNKASEIIKANKIKIDGKIITKSSFNVDDSMNVEVLEDDFYVSRAAYKLKYFLDEININLKNKNSLDIGSSTG
jgi:23S rRNA (cytidine1920-2'-O)/16S rRNA (cytidine1409-2'-O)-methyltransferase